MIFPSSPRSLRNILKSRLWIITHLCFDWFLTLCKSRSRLKSIIALLTQCLSLTFPKILHIVESVPRRLVSSVWLDVVTLLYRAWLHVNRIDGLRSSEKKFQRY
ncbi:uncharacterized protein BO72DRAFT_138874 [Aspergillus fijiensis CBS 313.89]|uniref:Uncharacterized protein n=1 Tax=Aspergillus fijiensis CBS 313.89 TaxID=1448319 RepID=A0A8G1W2J4_9EURO|nr:uncharacterized protein BO72DRAFT_138874 [Aspergillus fijiensis CBS 313.89]RAK82095.1 hypothetical protein BO72DRAFT_138874 [Aspergillus fijiensis CBS 313.89]